MVSLGVYNSQKIVDSSHEYEIPKRRVLSVDDMPLWEKSEAYLEYLGFLTALNEAAEGKSNKAQVKRSAATERMLELLDRVDAITTDIPPIQQPQRFGNKAFRTWHARLKEEAQDLVVAALGGTLEQAAAEIKEYLTESFGNATRIDYGTGHEMAFCMFLCCLFKVGNFTSADQPAVVCYIFARYLEVVRRLQTVYKMEPAGSRGVWALDDFQFIPFIWGSSQLIGNPTISPSSFVQQDVIDLYANDFLFIGCIKFITQVKVGPFAEHSNQLWNISGVAAWEKINSGLIKMYKAEVMGKLPVVQHVLFGSLLCFKPAEIQTDRNHPAAPECVPAGK